ncbi:MAG: hypothetical protein RIF32_06900 [Leptospirales bacterium]
MDEMEYDKTRKSIKAQDLGKKDRKDLMQKFQGAGGQVQTERSVRDQEQEAESGGRGGRRGVGVGEAPKLPSQIAREKARAEADREGAVRRMRDAEEKEATSFFARFSIKMRCWMNGVTPYGSDLVQPKVLSKFNLDAKRAIMECQILGNDLFMNNRKTAQTIIKDLDQKNPLLVELIERASKLYDRGELSDLVSSYTPGSRIPVHLDSIRVPAFTLLRKLYYLKPFQETYLTAVDLAIDIQQREEKKQAALYATKKKKIRQEWKMLMNSIYPDLVLLAQRSEMKKAEPGTRLFDDMIGVMDGDRVGQRTAGEGLGELEEARAAKKDSDGEDKGENESGETEEGGEEAPAKEPSQEDKELAYGYRIMKIFTSETLRKKHDRRGDYAALKDQDKVLIAYLFFLEFEEEYSFILTTPQIHLEPMYQGGVKHDYRQKMRDVYEESRLVEDSFKKYLHEGSEYNRIVGESVDPARYVEHAKKVEILDARRGPSGREARIEIKEYMEKVNALLHALITDMRGPNKIVTNRDDVVQFQMERDKRKRLNGKPVKDCVMQAYCFTAGLIDRLEGGDLFGGVIELNEEEFAAAFAQRTTE